MEAEDALLLTLLVFVPALLVPAGFWFPGVAIIFTAFIFGE